MNQQVTKLGCAYSNHNNIGGNGRAAVYIRNGLMAAIVTMGGAVIII